MTMPGLLDCPACGENEWAPWLVTPSKVSCQKCGAVIPKSRITAKGSRRKLRSQEGTRATRRTRRSRKHEAESAKKLGADMVPGSGNRNTASGKSDFVVKELLRSEHKETEKSGFRLDLKTILKIEQEALATGCLPALHVRFIRQGASDKTYVLVREDDLAALVREVHEAKND